MAEDPLQMICYHSRRGSDMAKCSPGISSLLHCRSGDFGDGEEEGQKLLSEGEGYRARSRAASQGSKCE